MTTFSVDYSSWVADPAGFVETSEKIALPDGSEFVSSKVSLKGSFDLTVGGVTRRVEGSFIPSNWLDEVWDFDPVDRLPIRLDYEGEVFVPASLADFFSEGLFFSLAAGLSADGRVMSPAVCSKPDEVAGASIEPVKRGCGSGSMLTYGYFERDFPSLFRALRWAA